MNRLTLTFANPKLAWRKIFKGSRSLTEIDLFELKKFMRGKGVILEAGASDGVDTLKLASYFPNHIVLALEPVQEQFIETARTTSSFSNVRTFNLALSSQSGMAKIHIGKSGAGLSGMGSSSLLKPKEHLLEFPEIDFSEIRSVETVTLEDFSNSHNVKFIDLLWLDVQGAELSVLLQNSGFVKRIVRAIHLEISRKELYEGAPIYKDVVGALIDLDFKIVIDRVGRLSGNVLAVNRHI
jgi:FkbM family methyltransferase